MNNTTTNIDRFLADIVRRDRALAELDRADEELTYARNHGDAQQVADARRDYVNAVEAVAQCSEATR